MDHAELKALWLEEEKTAQIRGWDFSQMDGRLDNEEHLPWDYAAIIRKYLKDDMEILDYDTGGGEYCTTCHHFDNW